MARGQRPARTRTVLCALRALSRAPGAPACVGQPETAAGSRAPRTAPPALRPARAVGVGDYLATKGIKKAAVQRALDNLAAAGKLTAKVCTRARRRRAACVACAAAACASAATSGPKHESPSPDGGGRRARRVLQPANRPATTPAPLLTRARHRVCLLTSVCLAHHPLPTQEFGKTKIYLPPQEGLEVLGKEVRRRAPHHSDACVGVVQRGRVGVAGWRDSGCYE